MQLSFVLVLLMALLSFTNAHAAMLANTFKMLQLRRNPAPVVVANDDDDDDSYDDESD